MWIKLMTNRACNRAKSMNLVVLLCLVTVCSKGQTMQEWTNQKELQTAYKLNQIVALRAYLGVAKKGYELVRVGWNVVGAIQDGEFSLHRDYFSSLGQVHPVVSTYPKAGNILRVVRQINREVDWMKAYLKSSNELDASEKGTISRFNQSALVRSTHIISQLEAVLTSGSYEMDDGERLSAIDELDREITKLYMPLKAYNDRIRSLESNRNRKEIEQRHFNTLYDVR